MKYFFAIVIFFTTSIAHSASCCGSNISAPALITTQENYRLSFSQSTSERSLYVRADGTVIEPSIKKSKSTQALRLGHIFNNSPYQIFASFKKTEDQVADSEVGTGLQYSLEDKPYDLYQWLSLGIPTGRSVYEINDASDIQTGSGIYSVQTGILMTRTFFWGDFSSSITLGHGLNRTVEQTKIEPKEFASIEFAGGYSYKAFRLGGGIGSTWNAGRRVITSDTDSNVKASRSWPVSLSLSYLYKLSLISLSYSDETLLGPAEFSDLNRSLTLNFVNRWY